VLRFVLERALYHIDGLFQSAVVANKTCHHCTFLEKGGENQRLFWSYGIKIAISKDELSNSGEVLGCGTKE